MQKTIPTIFLVFAVLFATAGISWGQAVDWEDLVKREGLYYLKISNVPFTGEVTGLRQGSIADGKRSGPWVGYHYNGRLEYKGSFINGTKNGPWVSYWPDGQLRYKGNFINGEPDGPWKEDI